MPSHSYDEKWDERFLALAEHVATWSKDPSRGVGAVIVDAKNRVVSMGYNGFPRGVADHAHRYEDRDTKYKFVAHAERNALDNAPLMVDGCTLYVSLLPCNECAKSIIQKGIARVVARSADHSGNGLNWDITREMFEEAGISVFIQR